MNPCYQRNGLTTFEYNKGARSALKIKECVEHGADVNYETYDGITPLYKAIINDNPEAARKLVDLGADINHECINGYTPLIFAIMYKRIDIIKMLLYKKVDVNHITIKNISPLLQAVKIGDMEIVKLLIDNGANVNKRFFNHEANECMSILEMIENNKLTGVFLPSFYKNKDMITRHLRQNKWHRISDIARMRNMQTK